MNFLALDYGTKNIGLAYSIKGIIFTLKSIKNDLSTISAIQQIITVHNVDKVYVGLSSGRVAKLTLKFIEKLKLVIKLPIETVEESVSTIEATQLLTKNKSKKGDYKKLVDSVSAAIILQRVIN